MAYLSHTTWANFLTLVRKLCIGQAGYATCYLSPHTGNEWLTHVTWHKEGKGPALAWEQGFSQHVSFRDTTSMVHIQRKHRQPTPSVSPCPPSPLGGGVGCRFGCACGYDLAVHSAQKQHEPESPKHLRCWDVNGIWDAEKQHCREHWNTGKEWNIRYHCLIALIYWYSEDCTSSVSGVSQ